MARIPRSPARVRRAADSARAWLHARRGLRWRHAAAPIAHGRCRKRGLRGERVGPGPPEEPILVAAGETPVSHAPGPTLSPRSPHLTAVPFGETALPRRCARAGP